MTTTTHTRQAAFDIAAGLRHNTDLAASAAEHVGIYTKAGLPGLADLSRKNGAQAARLRDQFTAQARKSSNPHLAAALRLYKITL